MGQLHVSPEVNWDDLDLLYGKKVYCDDEKQIERCQRVALSVLASWACSGQPMEGILWEWWSDAAGLSDPDDTRSIIQARFAKGDSCTQRGIVQ